MELSKIQELINECEEIEQNEFMFRGNFLTDIVEVQKELNAIKLNLPKVNRF